MNCKVQKYRVLVMGLLILSLMGLSACGRQESTANVPKLKDPVGVDVDTAKVKKMNLSSVNSYSGEVVPDMVGAYFANSGQAGAVKVEIGDKVKKGQLLATLTGSESTVKDLQKELESQIAENAETNASSQSKIEQLNIELKAVKKQKKQAKNTKDKNNLGKQIVQKQEEIKTERLRLKLQKQTQKQYIGELKSDIANAKKTSKLNRLYSPVNGEVIAKNLAPGDFVTGSVSPEKMRELLREQDMLAELARRAFARAGLKRTPTSSDRQQVELWCSDWCMNSELILYAAELASKKSTPFAEMKRMLSDWHERGIVSVSAAREETERSNAAHPAAAASKGKPVNRALNYKQRQYSAEELRALGVDLGDDVYED